MASRRIRLTSSVLVRVPDRPAESVEPGGSPVMVRETVSTGPHVSPTPSPEDGTPFQAEVVGASVRRRERIKGYRFGQVDRFRNRVVDQWLQRRLHREVRFDRKVGRGGEGRRHAIAVTLLAPPEMDGVVGQRKLARMAGPVQNRPGCVRCKHRLDPARHVAGQQADRARGRDRQQMAVADSVAADVVANAGRKRRDEGCGGVAVAIKRGKGTLLFRQQRDCR